MGKEDENEKTKEISNKTSDFCPAHCLAFGPALCPFPKTAEKTTDEKLRRAKPIRLYFITLH